MSPFIFRLPDIGEGVAEAEITIWHVKPGDHIAEDQSLVDVMTDKATVDMTSPLEGTVLAIHGAIGDMVPVGAPLVEIQPATDALSSPFHLAATSPPGPEPARMREAAPEDDLFPKGKGGEVRPLAAPATRHRAAQLGIPLQSVTATGSGGIITPADLDRYQANRLAESAVPAPHPGITEIKITGLRRKIAERMADSKRRIPHFTYVEEFDMTALEDMRTLLNAQRSDSQPKLTLLPFFMRAVVQLRPEFPSLNALYDDVAGILRVHDTVHIGIATQTPGGLMVPVVHNVDRLGLWDCARELSRVSAAARAGSASREDLTGSTITLTSLGALGGIAATPIINAPEVAILGPNRLIDRPVIVDGQLVTRKMMNLSASFDHRIIDGYEAASFVQRLKRLVEQPILIFSGAP